jgi:hypothetical protein
MIKYLSGTITGLALFRFFPQYALFIAIIAAIVLAIRIEEQHGFMKRLQTSKRKAKKKLPAMKTVSRAKKA